MRYKNLVVIIAFLMICSACEKDSTQTIPTPTAKVQKNAISTIPVAKTQSQSSRYLWIEFWTTESGTTSETRCENYSYIDGPGYHYEAKVLESPFNIDLTNAIGILGCGKQLKDPVGSGIFSNLLPITGFPYTSDWPDFCQVLTIDNIDESGTIFTKVKGQNISLEIGHEWTDSIIDNSSSKCQRVTTYRLTNFGFMGTTQIILPSK
jgi:hypothetical protein